jgi:hypothetical protein
VFVHLDFMVLPSVVGRRRYHRGVQHIYVVILNKEFIVPPRRASIFRQLGVEAKFRCPVGSLNSIVRPGTEPS